VTRLVVLVALSLTVVAANASADGTVGPTDVDWGDQTMPTPPSAAAQSPFTGPPAPTTAPMSWSQALNGISSLAEQTSQPFQHIQSGLSVVNALDAWSNYNRALSDLDQELTGRLARDHDGPSIPSSCSSGSGGTGCGECFERAYGEVNFTRFVLERLRTIHHLTMNYIRNAESLGDTTSGVHAVSGLAWQYAKQDIEASKRSFNKASREKYEALVNNMSRALHMVDDCERQFFQNPDWFNRYGFVYLNFVKDAYEPSE
jgi:hypothetical protein